VSEADLADLRAVPARLAEAVGERLYARDLACQRLGIHLEGIGPGHARMSMVVRSDMLNGHGNCHGGFIFALADSCFAYACNSRNQNTVASAGAIDFLAPAVGEERLIAECAEQSLAGRTGVYDVLVTGEGGRQVALFRGKSHRVAGAVLPEPDPGTP
jgi:acyl-CoA thioesterase